MTANAKIKSIVLLSAILAFLAAPPLRAGEATEAIRSAIDRGVEILNNAKLDGGKQREEVVDRLREIVYPLFDFEEMAKRSLGSHWRRIDLQQRKDFTALFTELLEVTYASKIDLYEGQKVDYTGESLDQEYASVDTKIIGKRGETFSAVYKLHRVAGKWRIYDIVVENISVVNNYRSQFNRVIASSSFEELLKRLKAKVS